MALAQTLVTPPALVVLDEQTTGLDPATGGKDYAGKPRPVVIIQDDRFDATSSVTVCALTTDPTDAHCCGYR